MVPYLATNGRGVLGGTRLLQLVALLVFLASSCALPMGAELIGRFWGDRSGSPGADWPGSTLRVLVRTTSAPTTLYVKFGNDTNLGRYFVGTVIDCSEGPKFEINSSQLALTLQLPAGSAGVHEVTFMRLTEAVYGESTGNTIFQDISVSDGDGLILTPHDADYRSFRSTCSRARKLLFLGDSFTAAYGVDGTEPCSYSPDTEDIRHSHAFFTSQALQADMQVVAWSGKGVVRNYGDVNPTSKEPLPVYYNRTLANQPSSYYQPKLFHADAVVVMLGTNDYSTQPNPSDEDFVGGLVAFSSLIQSDYKCPVLLLCAPAAAGKQCENIEKAASRSGAVYVHIENSAFDGGKGCDGHPNQQTEKNISAAVVPVLQQVLKISV